MFETLFVLFIKFLILVFGLCVIFLSRNPIHSTLSLIGVALGIASIFVWLGLEYMGLTLVIVYIGAIVIMFLFVIMMLDIQNINITNKYNLYTSLIMFMYLFLPIYFIKKVNFKCYMKNDITPIYNWYDWALSVDNIKLVGEILYKFYIIYVILSGLILFVATMGAIVLSNFADDN